MARKLTGFLPYTQVDDDVIVRDPLTAAPVTGTTLRGSRTLDSVRGSIFDNGGDGLAGLGINWAGLGVTAADVIHGCSFSVEVESGWLAKAVAQNETLFDSYVTSTNRFSAPRRQIGRTYIDALIRAAKFTARADLHASSYTDRDYVTVYCSYQFGGALHMYVDGLHFSTTEFLSADAAVTSALFNNFHVGNSHNSSVRAPNTHYMRNFQFIGRPLMLPTTHGFRNVHAYGDSLMERAGYPGTNWPMLYLKPDYPDLTGAGPSNTTNTTSTFRDMAGLITFQRLLAEQGIYIGRQYQPQNAANANLLNCARPAVQNYAIGGAGIDGGVLTHTLEQQIDRALARGDVPDLVLIHVGQNDLGNLSVTLDATWKGLYEAQIDRILARNPNCKLVLCTMTSPKASSEFDDTYDDRVDAINGLIREIVASYGESTVCELFAPFGGHAPDTSLFLTDDRHHSDTGTALFGTLLAASAVSVAGR